MGHNRIDEPCNESTVDHVSTELASLSNCAGDDRSRSSRKDELEEPRGEEPSSIINIDAELMHEYRI